MSIYNGLVAETKLHLALAVAVRDAWTSRDEGGLREAIRNFWHAVSPSRIASPESFDVEANNTACEDLIVIAGGQSADCPILCTRDYVHGLRDLLGVRFVPRFKRHPERKLILLGPPEVEVLPDVRGPGEEEIDASISKLASSEGQLWLSLARPELTKTCRLIDDRAALVVSESRRSLSSQGLTCPTATTNIESERPAAKRNEKWAEWEMEGLTPAKIRDKWNALSEDERKQITSSKWEKIEFDHRGIDLVKKAIRFQINRG